MEDDFEYDVKLPSPPAAEDLLESHDLSQLKPTHKEPVVFLLGWLGCKNQHLEKYSKIYEDKGCATISYTASSDILFFHPRKAREIAKKLLDLIFEISFEESPIFFHAFSNGGSMIYRHISSLAQLEEYKRLDIKGCIFDSAPGKRRIFKAAKALMLSTQGNFLIKYIMGFGIIIYLLVDYFYDAVKRVICPSDDWSVHTLYEAIKTERNMCPQMFLYSKSDDIIYHSDIEELINYREKIGAVVIKQCWDVSKHVCHLREHREAYIQMCHHFLDVCLKRENTIK